MMKKTILEIYALAVSFFTLACLAITSSVLIWDLVEISQPELTMSSYQYKCHHSDQDYKDCFSDRPEYTREKNPEVFPTDAKLTAKRTTSYQRELKAEQRDGLQSMIQSIIVIVISIIIFLIHWQLAKRSRENNS
ncbi:hypothetical protein [Spartinivicinus ruber]|uniref:hypothetical protein n=1 Tax=Spartinivicinus ruber TaxID=2683272 RepID=UPI0013D7436F|nr:hypothetical protein [Spartinivicinus ruber]